MLSNQSHCIEVRRKNTADRKLLESLTSFFLQAMEVGGDSGRLTCTALPSLTLIVQWSSKRFHPLQHWYHSSWQILLESQNVHRCIFQLQKNSTLVERGRWKKKGSFTLRKLCDWAASDERVRGRNEWEDAMKTVSFVWVRGCVEEGLLYPQMTAP